MTKTFQEENNEILSFAIENAFFKPLRKTEAEKSPTEKEMIIECYLTTACNQTCSYCYLCKYGDELYPKEIKDLDVILKNFKIFISYLREERIKPSRLDLFSGEIWGFDFGNKVLQSLYEEILKGFQPRAVVIPSNFSFMLNKSSKNIIEDFLQKYKDAGVKLAFSCSNDGLYLDLMTRPLNEENAFETKKGTETYYHELFEFCKKWGLGFHPMVSAHGIQYWKENFQWWEENLGLYNFDVFNSIMFLEVRNDDWTDEAIKHYLEYLNYSTNYMINNFFLDHDDPSVFVFGKWAHRKLKTKSVQQYMPHLLSRNAFYPGCTINRALIVRMGDLAIVPCHRTSYDQFLFGYFNVENEKIVGVTAKNIQLMNQIWFSNMTGNAKCGECPYAHWCMKGCFGSQYEVSGELFYPCETVCNLYKARTIFLYFKYKKLNILEPTEDESLIYLMEKSEICETEEFKKWKDFVLTII